MESWSRTLSRFKLLYREEPKLVNGQIQGFGTKRKRVANKYLSLIREHLEEYDESYWEHFVSAITYSSKFFYLSMCSFLHAFLPCCFMNTARKSIEDIKLHMMNREYKKESQLY